MPDTPANVRIQPALPEDVPAVLDLWLKAGSVPSVTDTPDDLHRLVAETGSLLVARIDGALVGTVIAGWDGWRGNIYRLAVLPQFRRRGIASALVREAERLLRRRGCSRVTALVVHEHRHAVAFWEAVGYGRDRRIARHVKTLPSR